MLPPAVYFGNDWFADNRTSSHHMAAQLAQRTRVLYVETPGLRPPAATTRDFRRSIVKVARSMRGAAQITPSLRVQTLAQVPLHGSRSVNYLNRALGLGRVRRAIVRQGFSQPMIWCTVPHAAGVATRLRQATLVYYCIDQYAALPGVDVEAVTRFDRDLAIAADLVVTASQPVFAAKQRLNPNTVLLPHGVDFAHFSTARDRSGVRPAALAGISGPVVGFIGLIERWIDLELIDWLARELPDVTFALIGRVAVDRSELPGAPNVKILGPCPYEELPAYGRRFDVAIIPYKPTEQVAAANPLKLREYLAMGLPVVSVRTPEVSRFADVVTIADTRDAFRDALRRAITHRGDEAAIARRMEAVAGATWSARLDELVPYLHAAIEQRRRRGV